MRKNSNTITRSLSVVAAAVAMLSMGACTTTGPNDTGSVDSAHHAINRGYEETLSRLYQSAPSSRELVSRARGVLIFPSVLEAGFVVGAEYGKGELRVGNNVEGYYKTTAGSIGFQAGAQSKAIIVLFMTQDSLDNFRASKGWTVGADATVALATIGANGDIDSNTVKQPVVGFVVTNAGLMAGVSLQGAKITRL